MAFSPAASAYLADLLTGLGTGFLSAPRGAPPLAGFGMGIQNANALMAQRQQQADQGQERAFRAQQIQQQQQAYAEAEQQKAAQRAAFSQLLPATANQAGMRPTGAGPGVSASVPAAPVSPMLSGMTPEQLAFLRSYGQADPGGALSMIGTQAFKAPAAPVVNDGMQYNANGTWTPIPGYLEQKKAIAEAGRAPVQPPQLPPEIQEYQMDQADRKAKGLARQGFGEWKTGLAAPKAPSLIALYGPDGKPKSFQDTDPTIPGMLSNGWTTVAPVATAKDVTADEIKSLGLPEGTVAQRDEHNNIKVVSSPKDPPADIQEYLYAKGQGFTGGYMDYQASKKGQGFDVQLPDGTHITQGGAIKPPNESQMAAASRAQLMKDGVDALEKLYDDPNISPVRVAGADTLNNFGPFGKLAAGNMQSDAEQQFDAAKASALEGLAASVTGAGVAKEQFTRYEQMLPALTDKPETRKAKLKAANSYLNTLLANAGAAAIPVMGQAAAGKPTAGTVDATVPADLPAGSTYAGQTKDGKRAFKLPDGSLVSE